MRNVNLFVITFFAVSVSELHAQIGSFIRHEGIFIRASMFDASNPVASTSNGSLIRLERSYQAINGSVGINFIQWNGFGFGLGVTSSSYNIDPYVENLGTQTILYTDASISPVLFDPFIVLTMSKRAAIVLSGLAGWKFHSFDYQDTSTVSGSASTYKGSTTKSIPHIGGGAGIWYALNKRIIFNMEYQLLAALKSNPSALQYRVDNMHFYTTETTKEPSRFSGQFIAGLIFRFF